MERTKGIEDFDDLSLSAFYVNALLVRPFTRHEQMHSYAVHSLCIQIVKIQCKNYQSLSCQNVKYAGHNDLFQRRPQIKGLLLAESACDNIIFADNWDIFLSKSNAECLRTQSFCSSTSKLSYLWHKCRGCQGYICSESLFEHTHDHNLLCTQMNKIS